MGHIERIIRSGAAINLAPLLPPTERVHRILDALNTIDGDRLAPVRQSLGDGFSYEEIAWLEILRTANTTE